MKSNNADVATVLALEKPARELLEATKAAQPAIKRLNKAAYPGVGDKTGWLHDQLTTTLDVRTMGSLVEVVDALEMFRAANGNLAAWDYQFFVEHLGEDVEGAAKMPRVV